jgi:hypothetical protein
VFWILEYISLVCFNQFRRPHKKLDGALPIPLHLDKIINFGQIEEEILSKRLPKEWGKIEIGLICYRTSTTSKADHFDLKLDNAIMAFITECKKKNSVQLCVYSEKKDKQRGHFGSSITSIEDTVVC